MNSKIRELEEEIINQQSYLSQHPMYKELKDLDSLKVFMGHHIFAVWDFMSLLKGLQRKITCVELPWYPSSYSKKLVRLINEIVLSEESDLDHLGGVSDHYTLYINAMEEIGINTLPYVETLKSLDFSHSRPAIREFVSFNLELAQSGATHKIAGAFFFGREKLIPGMFTGLLSNLREKQNVFPALEYYLERHIHLDGDEHSHLAKECLVELCGSDSTLYREALEVGVQSLILRAKLWDDVHHQLSKS